MFLFLKASSDWADAMSITSISVSILTDWADVEAENIRAIAMSLILSMILQF
jgi:hypothetical protein